MLAQAAGFAFLAALSPTAMLIAAVYLGSARPRRTALFYLAGAIVMCVAAGVVIIVVLHAGHLNLPHQRSPRYGLRLGLGVVALAAAVVVARRGARPRGSDQKKGLMSRLVARPSPLTAFTAGLLIFSPSVTFIAAIQVIATAKASDLLIATGLALVVAIDVLGVLLPFVLYLIAPAPTTRRLRAFDHWLHAHGHVLILGGLAVAGVVLLLDGMLGLAGAI